VRRELEKGEAGTALTASIDGFFDELTRIGKDMTQKLGVSTAHTTVDYYGSLLCFALMRFMPVNHPTLQHAIARLEQADPNAASIQERKKEILTWTQEDHHPRVHEVLQNYAEAGINLTAKQDYAALKTLEIIQMAPTIAVLLSPGQKGTMLEHIQDRVPQLNGEMMEAMYADMSMPEKRHKFRFWKNKPEYPKT
jgi:hypothetical protein